MSLFGRRERRENAGLRAENARLRAERDQFEEERNTAVFNRQQVLGQLASADTANRRLADRNLELGRRLSQCAEADPEYAASLERRVARLQKAGKRLLAAYALEQHRSNHQQALGDEADRKAIEQWEKRVKARDAWTAPVELEKRPVDGGSWRPTHPAVDLRRALDRCVALEERLARAEGRKPKGVLS
jgi:hypothetical protein